jgi:hypothetical protein
VGVQGILNSPEDDDSIDGDEYVQVLVGKNYFLFTANPPPKRPAFRDEDGVQQPVPLSVTYPLVQWAPPSSVLSDEKRSVYQAAVNETGNISFAIESRQAADFAVTVDILCERTEAAIQQWQVETHAAILQALAKAQGDYADAQAKRRFEERAAAQLGGNPDANRKIEQLELKKACIALLTGHNLLFVDDQFNESPFGAVQDQSHHFLPVKTTAQEQGSFIRFFEQVFECEHMMYLFYPYYWARDEKWKELALKTDEDPLFADFLRAGSARVVIPLRPELEQDALYFFMTGQI